MAGKKTQKHLRWTPPGPDAPAIFEIPTHDPPLAPRDEVVFLLHTGAEIEHALLVQYLYAAYSLKSPKEVPPEHGPKVRAWKRTLLEIAREEMGHLITVQNLLRLIGGPLNLEREDYPFRSGLYPFPFRLEPLSKGSLAKYVVAEMPFVREPSEETEEIVTRATGSGSIPANQVGEIYARVMQLLSPSEPGGEAHLSEDDFAADAGTRLARYDAWGGAASVLVPDIVGLPDALAAISELAEQGEGMEDSADRPSHYQRLLAIYREFPEAGAGGEQAWEPVYPVPVDPDTGPSEGVTIEPEGGRITHPRSLKWAKLFNLRYRLLLAYLSHFLQCDGPLLDDEADYTTRGLLNRWTFDEMRHLSLVASRLVTLPKAEVDPEQPERAGAPFELPYTLNLPDRDRERWRTHLDVMSTCLSLEHAIEEAHPEDRDDPLLRGLILHDIEAQRLARAAMAGEALSYTERDFLKVVRLLEGSVRGFRIGAHRNFWRGLTRDQFVALSVFG
ncbi:MAG TPA: ferritin-like protein, partial [Chloroflexia bacterium]|nr:ferritin-like protein [Chloroflexia bacterium]